MLRHLLAILVLPFTMAVLVPRWLLRGEERREWGALAGAPVPELLRLLLGGALLIAGAALFAWCVALFARVGRGTLAPWDPTRRLVVVGPYGHLRNPMISGVAAVLGGEALLFRSARLAAWLALFVAINHLYFLLVEEPGLARRFGSEYDVYRAAVPRWIPRWRGWRGERDGPAAV